MNNNNILDLFSTFLQTYNTALLEDDASNNDIVNHLHKQDTEYLERILKRLDEIEKRIERLENDKTRE